MSRIVNTGSLIAVAALIVLACSLGGQLFRVSFLGSDLAVFHYRCWCIVLCRNVRRWESAAAGNSRLHITFVGLMLFLQNLSVMGKLV